MDDVADILLGLAAGHRGAALAQARAMASRRPNGLAPALVRALERDRGDIWRDDGAGFRRFIDGGGNVGLYQAAAQALAAAHAEAQPATVLDVGCGDGRLSVAAVRPGLQRIDLLDPSGERLAQAARRFARAGVEVVTHERGAVELLVATGDHDGAAWDVAQSTFALVALPPPDRARVLAALARRVGLLLVMEFDVPAFADRSAEHARYAADRYEVGVAEYARDDQVVDEFLMPVLLAQFDPGAPRATWEQPVEAWVADLRAAGFGDVSHRPIADYWWAPAHLLVAKGAAAD